MGQDIASLPLQSSHGLLTSSPALPSSHLITLTALLPGTHYPTLAPSLSSVPHSEHQQSSPSTAVSSGLKHPLGGYCVPTPQTYLPPHLLASYLECKLVFLLPAQTPDGHTVPSWALRKHSQRTSGSAGELVRSRDSWALGRIKCLHLQPRASP